jgi:hypothetical protein
VLFSALRRTLFAVDNLSMSLYLSSDQISLALDDVSDDESTGDAIPFESAENGKKDKVKEDENKASEVEESEDDDEEGVYVHYMRS